MTSDHQSKEQVNRRLCDWIESLRPGEALGALGVEPFSSNLAWQIAMQLLREARRAVDDGNPRNELVQRIEEFLGVVDESTASVALVVPCSLCFSPNSCKRDGCFNEKRAASVAACVQNEASVLLKEIERLRAELEERDASFDLRWKADMRAIKRWQDAAPGRGLIWPDHADLCVWLLEQLPAFSAGDKLTCLRDCWNCDTPVEESDKCPECAAVNPWYERATVVADSSTGDSGG